MKTTGTVILFLLLLAKTVCAQMDIGLARQLDSMEAADHKNRVILQKADLLLLNKATRESVAKKVAMTDQANFPVLETIVNTHGYPGYNLVGKKSSHNFNLLLLHQEKHPDFQQSVLDKMKPEVDKKNASAYDYAILVDKLKLTEKQPQVYGTQVQVNKDSTSYEPKPVAEPEKLNERRQSLGLTTIEEYIQMMNNGVFDTQKKK